MIRKHFRFPSDWKNIVSFHLIWFLVCHFVPMLMSHSMWGIVTDHSVIVDSLIWRFIVISVKFTSRFYRLFFVKHLGKNGIDIENIFLIFLSSFFFLDIVFVGFFIWYGLVAWVLLNHSVKMHSSCVTAFEKFQ